MLNKLVCKVVSTTKAQAGAGREIKYRSIIYIEISSTAKNMGTKNNLRSRESLWQHMKGWNVLQLMEAGGKRKNF